MTPQETRKTIFDQIRISAHCPSHTYTKDSKEPSQSHFTLMSKCPKIYLFKQFCSVLFLSRPRSEGWPHHGRTLSIYLYPMSFRLTLPQTVLSTTSCCLSRACVVFLACIHLALFLALFLSPGNSLVSSQYASFLALTVSKSPSLLKLC